MKGYLGCECNGVYLRCRDVGEPLKDGFCAREYGDSFCKTLMYRRYGFEIIG